MLVKFMVFTLLISLLDPQRSVYAADRPLSLLDPQSPVYSADKPTKPLSLAPVFIKPPEQPALAWLLELGQRLNREPKNYRIQDEMCQTLMGKYGIGTIPATPTETNNIVQTITQLSRTSPQTLANCYNINERVSKETKLNPIERDHINAVGLLAVFAHEVNSYPPDRAEEAFNNIKRGIYTDIAAIYTGEMKNKYRIDLNIKEIYENKKDYINKIIQKSSDAIEEMLKVSRGGFALSADELEARRKQMGTILMTPEIHQLDFSRARERQDDYQGRFLKALSHDNGVLTPDAVLLFLVGAKIIEESVLWRPGDIESKELTGGTHTEIVFLVTIRNRALLMDKSPTVPTRYVVKTSRWPGGVQTSFAKKRKVQTPIKELQDLARIRSNAEFMRLIKEQNEIPPTDPRYGFANIILDKQSYFYMDVKGVKHFVSVFPRAPGDNVLSIQENKEVDNKTKEEMAYRIGLALGKLHYLTASEAGRKDLEDGSIHFREFVTVTQGDLHEGNVFYDIISRKVSFIDNANLALSLKTPLNPAVDIMLIAPFIKKISVDALIKFCEGYLAAYPGRAKVGITRFFVAKDFMPAPKRTKEEVEKDMARSRAFMASFR